MYFQDMCKTKSKLENFAQKSPKSSTSDLNLIKFFIKIRKLTYFSWNYYLLSHPDNIIRTKLVNS